EIYYVYLIITKIQPHLFILFDSLCQLFLLCKNNTINANKQGHPRMSTLFINNHYWATRIRPWGMTGPKPVALPLGYSPMLNMVEGERFELPNPEGADLQSAAFSHFATPP